MKTLVMEKMPSLFYEIMAENNWKDQFFEPGEIENSRVEICIIRTATQFDAVMMDCFPKLKQIIRAGTGYDNINVKEAERRGIVVCHTPEANALAAYEQTIAFIFGLIKHINISKPAVLNRTWREGHPSNWEISDLKVLIVGVGRVGKQVAKALQFLGAEVKGVDPYLNDSIWSELGLDSVSYEDGLAWCNTISYHCPLTSKTVDYFNASTLKFLQNPIWLINAARGGVVNEAILAEGLDGGIILGAGLDVFDTEPWVPLNFGGYNNVILSPHVGARTLKAKLRLARETLDVWQAYGESEKIISEVDSRFLLF